MSSSQPVEKAVEKAEVAVENKVDTMVKEDGKPLEGLTDNSRFDRLECPIRYEQ